MTAYQPVGELPLHLPSMPMARATSTHRVTATKGSSAKVADAVVSIALERDGTVWRAGSNEHHQLGDRSEGIRRGWKQVFQVVD